MCKYKSIYKIHLESKQYAAKGHTLFFKKTYKFSVEIIGY